MTDNWSEPQKMVVTRADKVDRLCKFPKVLEGLQCYNVFFEGSTAGNWMYFAQSPHVGQEMDIRINRTEDASGKKYNNHFTAEQYAKITAAPSGGGQIPKMKDYALENRQKAADAAIAFKGDRDWDLHTTLTLADAIVEYYKNGAKPAKRKVE